MWENLIFSTIRKSSKIYVAFGLQNENKANRNKITERMEQRKNNNKNVILLFCGWIKLYMELFLNV